MHLQCPEPMVPEIPQCGDGEGGIEFVLVGDEGLDVVALRCVAGVLGGDDHLFDCAVPAEVAIAGDDLDWMGDTSLVFSSVMSSLARTREYSMMRRSLWSSSRRADLSFLSLFCGRDTMTNPESLASEWLEWLEGAGEVGLLGAGVLRYAREWGWEWFFMSWFSKCYIELRLKWPINTVVVN